MRVIQLKFTKKNVIFFKTGGRAPGAPVLDPPLGSYKKKNCRQFYGEIDNNFSIDIFIM